MRDLLSVREQGPGQLPLHYNRLLCSRLRSRETAGAGDTVGTLPAPHVRRGRGGGHVRRCGCFGKPSGGYLKKSRHVTCDPAGAAPSRLSPRIGRHVSLRTRHRQTFAAAFRPGSPKRTGCKCPSPGGWVKKMWPVPRMARDAALTRDEAGTRPPRGMSPRNTNLRETSQRHEAPSCVIPFTRSVRDGPVYTHGSWQGLWEGN